MAGVEKALRRIPVAAPALVGREAEYVADCMASNWISSNGKYVGAFEDCFAEYCGTHHAFSCSNGTVALHLALLALGVGPGDEVIVPSLTYVATANAVRYCGAEPVFVDSEEATWNLDPARVAEAITPQTRAIIVVHLFGHPADMDPILEIARRHGVAVVEDAAEAHGATYKGQMVGSMGDVSTFSFYGNKIITTGEGGMVLTDDAELASCIKLLRGQGQDPERQYWFPVVGFNYRMTNVAAAIGLAQMERIDWHVERRRTIASTYRRLLENAPGISFSPELSWAQHAHWMSCLLLDPDVHLTRDDLRSSLDDEGIETRPFFHPIHTLPPYLDARGGPECTVAESLAARGLCLPSGASLSAEDIEYVSAAVLAALGC